ncbi:MAG: type II toxin-antitoxin system VapC family toxin [Synechococcaceae cyanobacterium]|nr:type II toxin-antitoxin system VapC family toxin [Synechococcaceae cyanobacterium]
MVIDSSAVLAILQDEPERRPFNAVIAAARSCSLSTATLVELSIVLQARFGTEGHADLVLFLRTAQVEIANFNQEQAEIARAAFVRFGKGHHRAGLNLGDCFSYALARFLDEPLLFKDDDFLHTDLRSATD